MMKKMFFFKFNMKQSSSREIKFIKPHPTWLKMNDYPIN